MTRSLLFLCLAAVLSCGVPALHAQPRPLTALDARVEAARAGGADAAAARSLAQAVGEALGGETKLTAGPAGAWFGYAVSISGNRALVGANREGAAYVFAYDGTTWTQQARLTGSGASADFGSAVALDGDRALVGARIAGAAYVFAFVGGAWVEQARLVPSVPSDPDFGAAVSISGDRALVGAAEELGGLPCGTVRGSAYVYAYNGAAWTEQARLLAADGASGDCFGSAVALDGDRALVGAYGDDFVRGSAYVFGYTGFTWTQRAKLTASDAEPGERFGVAVALSGDRALIGADEGISGGDAGGVAYVFAFNGATWTERQRLEASDRPPLFLDRRDDRFGCAVAIDGDRALIGAQYGIYNGDRNDQRGAAYRFAFDGTTWTETERIMASDAARDDRFGAAVALDGEVALVGAYWNDAAGANSGAAYVYGVPEGELTYALAVAPEEVGVGDTVTVVVTVENGTTGPLTNVRPTGPMVATSGDGGAVVLLSGPTPPSVPSLGVGATDSLRYTFEATAQGHVTFTVGIEATDAGGQLVEGTNLCPACAELTIGAPIAFLAPAEDEIVPPGEPYAVRFEAPASVEAVDLYLVERDVDPDGGERVLVAEDVPAAAGVYAWDVPEDLRSPSTFLIAVDADDPEREAVSERFRVRIPWRVYRVVGTAEAPEYERLAYPDNVWSFDQSDANVWPEPYWKQPAHYYWDLSGYGYDPFYDTDVSYYPYRFRDYRQWQHAPWPAWVRAFGTAAAYVSMEPLPVPFQEYQLNQPDWAAVEHWEENVEVTVPKGAGGEPDAADRSYQGICYGISTAVLAAFQDPDRFDARFIPNTGGSRTLGQVPLNDEVRNALHAFQNYFEGVAEQELVAFHELFDPQTPRSVLEELRAMFERDEREEDRVLWFSSQMDTGPVGASEWGAHAVVPLGMERLEGGVYEVVVFDPNFGPAGAPIVTVDSTANSWSFLPGGFLGDTGTGLYTSVEARQVFALAQPPWAAPGGARVDEAGRPAAAPRGVTLMSVSVQAAASALVDPAGGGELRYEDGVLTETLGNAYAQFPLTGRPSTPRRYRAPVGAYRAEVTPDSGGVARLSADWGRLRLGYGRSGGALGARDHLDLSPEAGLALTAAEAGPVALTALATVVGVAGAERRSLQISDLALGAGVAVALGAVDDTTAFRLRGPAAATTYDLLLGRSVAGGARSFSHADVPLAAGSVHTIRPDWAHLAGGTVTVEVDLDGDGETDETLLLEDQGVTVSNEPGAPDDLPTAYALHAAYPNPFNDRATLRYDLPEAGAVRLTVYDLLGRRVAVLVDGEAEAGRHTAVLNGRGLASGTYVVRLVAGGQAFTQRLTLVR